MGVEIVLEALILLGLSAWLWLKFLDQGLKSFFDQLEQGQGALEGGAVILFFLIILSRVFRPWCAYRPGLFVSVGLLGTFVGVTFALKGLTSTISGEEIAQVMKATSLAFGTSVIGISLSIVATGFLRFDEFREEQETLHALESAQTFQRDNLSKLDAIQSGLGQLDQKLASSFTGAGEELLKQLKDFFEVERRLQADAMKEHRLAMQDHQLIMASHRDDFDAISTSVKDATEGFKGFVQTLGDLSQAAEAMGASADKLHAASGTISAGGTTLTAEVKKVLEGYQVLQTESKALLAAVSKHDVQLGGLLHAQQEALASTTQITSNLGELNEKVAAAIKELGDVAPKMVEPMETLLQDLTQSLSTNLKDLARKMQEHSDELHRAAVNAINLIKQQQDGLTDELFDSSAIIAAASHVQGTQFTNAVTGLQAEFREVLGELGTTMGKSAEKIGNAAADAVGQEMGTRTDVLREEAKAEAQVRNELLVKLADVSREVTRLVDSVSQDEARDAQAIQEQVKAILEAVKKLETQRSNTTHVQAELIDPDSSTVEPHEQSDSVNLLAEVQEPDSPAAEPEDEQPAGIENPVPTNGGPDQAQALVVQDLVEAPDTDSAATPEQENA